MSLWATGTSDHHARLSSLSMMAVLGMVIGLFAWHGHATAPQTASELDALVSPTVSAMPQEAEFPEPTPIIWEGYISRSFVGGEAIEVVSRTAPGGVFQAYMPVGQVSPVTDGPVRVQGLWRGWTCAYGGHDGNCVPEVDITSVEKRPIMVE